LKIMSTVNTSERQSLYAEVTSRIIAELEAGRLPWVQPWDASRCPCTLPHNAGSGTYSGINVLILWTSAIEQGFSSQRWLTYRQAEAAGAMSGAARRARWSAMLIASSTRGSRQGQGRRPRSAHRGLSQALYRVQWCAVTAEIKECYHG
jgi:antirestriction protein ArdC